MGNFANIDNVQRVQQGKIFQVKFAPVNFQSLTVQCNSLLKIPYSLLEIVPPFGFEILAKRYFYGSMKDAGIFLHHKKTGIFLGVLYFSSAQINNNVSAIYCWCGIFFR